MRLLEALVVVALSACTTSAVSSPSPSAPTASATAAPSLAPSPLVLAEDAAWDAVARASPNAARVRPTWLPDSLDRKNVAVTIDGSSYRVAYRANGSLREVLTFSLGPLPPLGPAPVSKLGIRVRGQPATLEFPATSSSWLRVSWREGTSDLAIETRELTGDELLRVAWSLQRDPVLARARDGACAPNDVPPDAVVRTLFALATSNDAQAVLDCWAREKVVDLQPAAPAWASYGPTTELDIRYLDRIGGRYWLGATFTFAKIPDPGLLGPHKTLFYQVGPEDGRWRIFDSGTAIAAVPPFGPKTTQLLPVADAFRSLSAKTAVRPILTPTVLTPGLVAQLSTGGADLSYRLLDDLHGIDLFVGVAVHNPPPPTDRGTQQRLPFRDDRRAFYQVNDASVASGRRILMWTEPGTTGCDRCQYLMSSDGLDEATFWSVARSLR